MNGIDETTVQELEAGLEKALAEAPVMAVITSPAEANDVAAHRLAVKDYRKKVDAFFRPGIKQAYELHKTLTAQFRRIDDPAAAAEKVDADKLSAWQIAEENRVRKAQAAAEAAQRNLEADQARKDGDKKLAKDIEAGKVAVSLPPAVPAPEKIAGLSTVILYRCEITSKSDLVKAIAKGALPLDWLEVNEGMINKMLDACKGSMTLPGVKVVEVRSHRSR